MAGKLIDLKAGKGYFVEGDGPAILIIHAWWGLNDFFKGLCTHLSKEGFSSLALDLYHGQIATDIERAKRLRVLLDRKVANEETTSAVAYLRQKREKKIGVIGFSMGANLALWAMDNCYKDVGATVLYYGTNGGRFRRAKSPVLGHFAEHDLYARPEQINALRGHLEAEDIPNAFHIYPGTRHWFMEEDRPEMILDPRNWLGSGQLSFCICHCEEHSDEAIFRLIRRLPRSSCSLAMTFE